MFISAAVLEEAGAGDEEPANKRLSLLKDLPVLAITDLIVDVAQKLVESGSMPKKASGDAPHVAIATC
jgi:hypothetical protein